MKNQIQGLRELGMWSINREHYPDDFLLYLLCKFDMWLMFEIYCNNDKYLQDLFDVEFDYYSPR